MSFEDFQVSHLPPPPQSPPARAKHHRRLPLALAVTALAAGGTLIIPVGAYAAGPGGNTALATSSTVSRYPAPVGNVIGTGIQVPGGEQVFYVGDASSLANKPDFHIGIFSAVRDSQGNLSQHFFTYDKTSGSPVSRGFHAFRHAPISSPITDFGYYVGAPRRITATVDGKVIEAHRARWSKSPGIVLVWFTRDQNPHRGGITNLTADE